MVECFRPILGANYQRRANNGLWIMNSTSIDTTRLAHLYCLNGCGLLWQTITVSIGQVRWVLVSLNQGYKTHIQIAIFLSNRLLLESIRSKGMDFKIGSDFHCERFNRENLLSLCNGNIIESRYRIIAKILYITSRTLLIICQQTVCCYIVFVIGPEVTWD